MKQRKIITICSSGSFYKDVMDVHDELKRLGFKVYVPKTALKMRQTGNFDINFYKVWFKDKNAYHLKRALMNDHFKKVKLADAILVYNAEKKGVKGYIGGNVLLEMFLAYQNKKPIFIWDDVGENSMLLEEVLGFDPIFINRDLSNIKLR